MDPRQARGWSVKLFIREPVEDLASEIIPVFHRWIRDDRLTDEIAVDVADYTHVHHGPWTVLVCHNGRYVLDAEAGRVGLVYVRKRTPEGSERPLEHILRRAATAARALEEEPSLGGRVRFRTDELLVRVYDRLWGSGGPESVSRLAAVVREQLRVIVEPRTDMRIESLSSGRQAPATLVRFRPPPPLRVLSGGDCRDSGANGGAS